MPGEKAAGKEAGGAGRGGRVVKDGRGRLAEKLAPENEGGEERCRPREQKVLRPGGHPADRAQWEGTAAAEEVRRETWPMCQSF